MELAEGWEWTRTRPGAAGTMAEFDSPHAWCPASVPGTVAQAMRDAGLWDGHTALLLDDDEFWYRTTFKGTGHDRLGFEGLATIAEVWVNGAQVLASDNMFRANSVDLITRPLNDLHLCFRSLNAHLAGKRGRARWRPRMISPPTLRFARTTLLGHMPGWCPMIHPVGPWRPITIQPIDNVPPWRSIDMRVDVHGNDGVVRARLTLDRSLDHPVRLFVGTDSVQFQPAGTGKVAATLRLANVRRWWPHTHGDPFRYPARLVAGETEYPLAPIGFRTVAIDYGTDGTGFALLVNGERVFCRGACWTCTDIVTLSGRRDDYAALLALARDGGINMIRVGGTMVYEADAFYDLCDELGLLVWQDFMLSNFDYPMQDEAFCASLTDEAEQFVRRTQPRASIAVLSGGSEVMQQAAMLGQPRKVWQDGPHRELIPHLCGSLRPDVPFVTNSPSGGDWPFLPNTGVTHYYGVGAYQRPLTDARQANVRFASECLGFANVPCARTVRDALPVSSITDPRWKAATPHDVGVSWDFEDIRDHYVKELFGVDPARLRYEDFERYLDVSRAVSCVVMETVFAEWRRKGSECAGGLVWQLRDLRPGAGWGVIDSLGRPKPAYHALARAFRPRQVVLTDEGLNGLHVHVVNEDATPLHARLTLVCLRDGRIPVREAECDVHVPARGTLALPSTELLPEFFDITYAYRFGPPFHNVSAAWLTDMTDGSVIADAYHFPNRALPPHENLGLEARVERADSSWMLCLTTRVLAQFVHVEDPHFRAEQDWFHLPPGQSRRVRLVPFDRPDVRPDGEVRALNLAGAVSFRSNR